MTESTSLVSVPIATSTGAATGLPFTFRKGRMELDGSMAIRKELSERLTYTKPDERVYALQCRKIHFKRFSTNIDGSRLDKKDRNCWITCSDGRPGDGGEDGIEAELAGPFSLEDGGDEYGVLERIEMDDEEILFRSE